MQGPLYSFVIYKILYFYAYTQVPDGVYTLRIPIYHENVHRNNKVGLLVINIIYNIGTQHLITIFSEFRMYRKYFRSRIRTGFNSVTCSVFLYIPISSSLSVSSISSSSELPFPPSRRC